MRPVDRGRNADTPTDIPPAGWSDILVRVARHTYEDRVMLIAGGVTYYLLLALVPGTSALISSFAFFVGPHTVQTQATMLGDLVPAAGRSIIADQLHRLSDQGATTLSLTFLGSIAFAIWSGNAGMKSLFDAINLAYNEDERRSLVRLNLVSLVFLVVFVAAIVLFVVAEVKLPAIVDRLHFASDTVRWLAIGFDAGTAVIGSLAVAALYRWGPCRRRAKWRWISPGMVLSIAVVVPVTTAFFWYLSHFNSYNITYGSLGTLIGFLTWIWISVTILIVGARLNAEMEHQTFNDTTVPPARALGRRGAFMADNVAGIDDPQSNETVRERRQAAVDILQGGPESRPRRRDRGAGLLPTASAYRGRWR